jgi:hypothetical protein
MCLAEGGPNMVSTAKLFVVSIVKDDIERIELVDSYIEASRLASFWDSKPGTKATFSPVGVSAK